MANTHCHALAPEQRCACGGLDRVTESLCETSGRDWDDALAGACISISGLARRGLDAARADREPVPRQANTVLKKGSRMACSTPAQP